MVTWGTNTLHTFGGAPAPAGGTPAPAPAGGIFGAAPATSPAPAFGGGAFGAPAPAPSTGTSLFGTSAPAPSGSLFGSTTSTSSLFGNTTPTASAGSSSFFGAPAPAPSAFGAPATPSTQAQLPAQAALQAHMDASARQEAERVRAELARLHQAYSGTSASTSKDDPKFVAIVYDPLTSEQRNQRWLQGMGDTQTILAPPRPPHVSEEQWKQAVVANPDPENYTPQALVGATDLQRRIAWQQERATDLVNHVSTMRKSQVTVQDRATRAAEDTAEKIRRHASLRNRLLHVMRRVELARCMNQQMQPDELKAAQRLVELNKEMDRVQGTLVALQDMARTQAATSTAQHGDMPVIPNAKAMTSILKDQRDKLFKLVTTAQRDQRDIALLQRRTLQGAAAN